MPEICAASLVNLLLPDDGCQKTIDAAGFRSMVSWSSTGLYHDVRDHGVMRIIESELWLSFWLTIQFGRI